MERALTKRIRRPAKTLEPAALPEEPQSALPTKCPLTAAISAIGGKWSLICLYWLDSGTRRFNQLHRLMPDISHKVLTETLRNLELHGLVARKVYAEVPPRVEYRISAHGKSVLPILQAVRSWGHDHIAWMNDSLTPTPASDPEGKP